MSALEHDALRLRHPRISHRPPLPAQASPRTVRIRRLQAEDYPQVAARIDDWSRGRFVSASLPRSFFQHFATTSLVLLEGEEIAGVLVGFQSQTDPETAYIHFVAIAPPHRPPGPCRLPSHHFLHLGARLGCREVQSIAPPVNSGLIAFHRQLDFDVVEAGGFACGIAVCPDYAGPGQHRVLFRRRLGAA